MGSGEGPWTLEMRGDDFAETTCFAMGTYMTSSDWFSSENEDDVSFWTLLGNTRPGYLEANWSSALGPYVYNAANEGWEVLQGNQVLAPGQAALYQPGTTNNFYVGFGQPSTKMTDEITSFRDESCRFELTALADGVNPDGTRLYPSDAAGIGFDVAFDAYHMGYGHAANLYMDVAGTHFDKNYLPLSEGMTSAYDLKFSSYAPGTYTITLDEASMCWQDRIEIENLETGSFHNLTTGDFTFDYAEANEVVAWKLHFNRLNPCEAEDFGGELTSESTVDVAEALLAETELNAYMQDGALMLQLSGVEAGARWTGSIRDAAARLIAELDSQGRAVWSEDLPANLDGGIYHIELQSPDQGRLTTKVFIQ